METFDPILAIICGAAFGSFLCCFNDRLAKVSGFGEGFLSGSPAETFRYLLGRRSHCFHCGTVLHWYQNIPVFSFLFLRGRCGTCSEKIPFRLIIFEISLGFSGFLCWLWFDSIAAIYAFLLLALMGAVFDFDRLYMHIPNLYTGGILWLGLLSSVHGVAPVPFEFSVYGVIVAFTILWTLRALFLYFKGVEALGSGDAPLAGALAAWIGVYQVPYFLFIASVIGILWIYIHSKILGRSVIGLAIPFGPSLVIACLVLLVFGNPHEISPLP